MNRRVQTSVWITKLPLHTHNVTFLHLTRNLLLRHTAEILLPEFTFCAAFKICYCSAALVTCKQQCSILMARKQKRCTIIVPFCTERKLFPLLQWNGGAMLPILEDLSVTHEATKVRTNVHPDSCWFWCIICYATASFCKVTVATDWWFVSDRSGRPLF